MTQIYAFANQKGGVGKTTTVVNLAAVMADWGLRVLVVDIDPQSNATTSLGAKPGSHECSMYDVLLDSITVEEAVVSTTWEGLNLLPSSPALAGATVELNNLADPRERARALRYAIQDISGYDYILVDSPPSLGILTVNSLCAADGVVVPVQCEYLALEGLSQLMHTIRLIQRGLNKSLIMRGVVMTMYDKRTNLAKEVVAEVQRYFPKQVFRVLIPRSVRLSEAPSYGEPGVLYSPKSQGSLAYRALTWDLLGEDGHDIDWTPPEEVLED